MRRVLPTVPQNCGGSVCSNAVPKLSSRSSRAQPLALSEDLLESKDEVLRLRPACGDECVQEEQEVIERLVLT